MSKLVNVIENNNDIIVNIPKYNSSIKLINDEIQLEVNKDISLIINGDFNIITNGELALSTYEHKLTLDSINSEIHLNSRISKKLKDLPDSIEFRERLDNETKQLTHTQQCNHEKFQKYIESLESRIINLENQLLKKDK